MRSVEYFLNLERYPLHQPESPRTQEMLAAFQKQMREEGVCVLPEFLSPAGLQELVAESEQKASECYHNTVHGNAYLEEIPKDLPSHHPMRLEDRTALGVLAYDQIPNESGLRKIYQWKNFVDFVGKIIGRGPLYEYACPLGAINVAVMKDQDYLRWHFDQSDFVVSVNLQDPVKGGKFEYVRNIRSKNDPCYDDVRNLLQGSRKNVEELHNPPGCLVLFEGRYTIHRVTEIQGEKLRLI
ncbi:MAG: hypothetical protein EB120_01600, partial [Proteobacteria bacterium]|nr:hypothetical protein [Pseudomonadota bacterium]